MTTVLVLGSTGMLGSMTFRYLRGIPKLQVLGATRDTFEAEAFALGISQRQSLNVDYIVNCIGVIKPFCKDGDAAGVRRAIITNALFPHRLAAAARASGARVIQVATDCVFSGAKGRYVEGDPHDALDAYGKTKSLGEVFDGSLLNIRCSTIGPELKNQANLLGWFLGHKDGTELKGFTHHLWNGVTTLQFARLCGMLVAGDGLYDRLLAVGHVHHFTPNSTVTKYQLLCQMNEAFDRKMTILPVSDIGPPIDRTITSRHSLLKEAFPAGTMRDAVGELAAYMGSELAAI
jgi:dTDP-4-dehydrorhamnose reductase